MTHGSYLHVSWRDIEGNANLTLSDLSTAMHSLFLQSDLGTNAIGLTQEELHLYYSKTNKQANYPFIKRSVPGKCLRAAAPNYSTSGTSGSL